ncbi:DUF4145 domain-containing protein [Vibrio harveyi]
MTSHPLLPMPSTNLEISESYALLGRALAYATDFEHNCRTLAHLTDVVNTNNEFSFEVYMLLKSGTLYEKIRSLVSKYSLPTHSEDSIHAARKARNNIAHSICIEHEKLLSSESGRLAFRANIMCEMDNYGEPVSSRHNTNTKTRQQRHIWLRGHRVFFCCI